VLRLARVQSGREVVALESVDVGGALAAIWKRLIEPLHSRNIRTEFTIEHGTNVRADAAMLAVILENLCVNAAIHTPGGGDVRVACHIDHDRIHFVMSNSTGHTCNSHDSIKNNAQDNSPHAQLHAYTPVDLQTNLHIGLGLLIVDSMCQAIGATLRTAQTITRYTVTLELQRA
jgi:K+-sensing histidine kinase KdpD